MINHANQCKEQHQKEQHQREQEWFTMRMNIKTQAGMLRQYQMEEQERGYKIQTLEFKSPQYILKNFISGNSPIRVVHVPGKKLRHMQGRNSIKASLENLIFLSKTVFLFCARSAERGFAMIMPPPQARLAGLYSAGLAALVIVIATALQLQAKTSPTAIIASHHTISNTFSTVNHKQKRSLSSSQQKKFQLQIKGLL
ncbi:MAG: hypothetical protein Q8T09_17860 [Candidatus Melainabacteria bacterium]|nr:hypothetical protein [Candidatus Melainabacteria bacterium]